MKRFSSGVWPIVDYPSPVYGPMLTHTQAAKGNNSVSCKRVGIKLRGGCGGRWLGRTGGRSDSIYKYKVCV